jgi:aerobic-type carbon monoxide dehydrogenase small subunit (CoxS/CutS family)
VARRELSGNLCRCTGYSGIVRAVVKAGEQLGGGAQ